MIFEIDTRFEDLANSQNDYAIEYENFRTSFSHDSYKVYNFICNKSQKTGRSKDKSISHILTKGNNSKVAVAILKFIDKNQDAKPILDIEAINLFVLEHCLNIGDSAPFYSENRYFELYKILNNMHYYYAIDAALDMYELISRSICTCQEYREESKVKRKAERITVKEKSKIKRAIKCGFSLPYNNFDIYYSKDDNQLYCHPICEYYSRNLYRNYTITPWYNYHYLTNHKSNEELEAESYYNGTTKEGLLELITSGNPYIANPFGKSKKLFQLNSVDWNNHRDRLSHFSYKEICQLLGIKAPTKNNKNRDSENHILNTYYSEHLTAMGLTSRLLLLNDKFEGWINIKGMRRIINYLLAIPYVFSRVFLLDDILEWIEVVGLVTYEDLGIIEKVIINFCQDRENYLSYRSHFSTLFFRYLKNHQGYFKRSDYDALVWGRKQLKNYIDFLCDFYNRTEIENFHNSINPPKKYQIRDFISIESFIIAQLCQMRVPQNSTNINDQFQVIS